MPNDYPIQPFFRFNKTKLAAAIVTASTLSICHTTSAAVLSVVPAAGSSDRVSEGETLPMVVEVFLNGSTATGTDSCVVNGDIIVGNSSIGGLSAEENEDFKVLTNSFSVNGTIGETVTSDPIPVEILNDTNDDEGTEGFSLRVTNVSFSGCTYYGEGPVDIGDGIEIIGPVEGYYTSSSRVIGILDGEVEEETPAPSSNTITLSTQSQQALKSPINLSVEAAKLQTQNLSNQLRRLRNGLRGNDLSALNINIGNETIAGNDVKQLLGAGAGDADIASKWGTFVGGAIQIGQEKADSESLDFNVHSLFVGADYRVNNSIIVGGALGYNNSTTDIKNSKSETKMNGLSLAAFSSYYYKENYYIDGIISYGLSDYQSQRELDNGATGVAKSETEGSELSIALNTGYYFRFDEHFLQLYSSLNFISADINGYQESLKSGSSSGDLYRVDDHDKESFTTSVGIEYGRAFNTAAGVITPQISLDWEQQHKDGTNAISGHLVGSTNNFSVDNTEQDRNYYNAGLGLSAVFAGGISAYGSYEVDLEREDFDVYDVSFGLRWEL